MRSSLALPAYAVIAAALLTGICGSQANAQQSTTQTLKTIPEDQQKAQDFILSDALYRVAQKGDGTLAFAFVQMQKARTPDDVSRVFQESLRNGQVDPVFDRDRIVPLMKMGVKYYTKGVATDAGLALVDGLDEYTKKLESGQKTLRLSAFSPEYATAAFAGSVDHLSPVARERLTKELATYLQRDYDGVVRDVREKRLISGPNSLEGKVYRDQFKVINEKLNVERELLDAQLKGMKASQQLMNRKAELELETKHFEAVTTLAGLILGPVVGAETASKITKVGQNISQMNQALKQFGPGGISPDKLLMFTNFVTAGIAIVGIVAASSQEDPTVAMLKAMMQQLEAMKKQLVQIENKIDDLTDLVLVGFARVLKGQQVLANELRDFRNIVTTQINDEAQLKAIRVYLDYLDHGDTDYPVRLTCASSLSKKSVEAGNECLGIFASKLSSKKLFTDHPNEATRPEIWSSEWSNQVLSHHLPDDPRSLIALQQLSYPFFFAESPSALRSTLARNHELVAAYSREVLGAAKRDTPLPNPEILARQLRAYLSAAKWQGQFQSEIAVGLTDEALSRIKQLDDFLADTVRSKDATNNLVSKLSESLTTYQDTAKSMIDELSKDTYAEEHRWFNSKNTNTPGVITFCPGSGDPPLPIPTGGLDSKIPQIFWIAQEMKLGVLGQCYEWEQAGDRQGPAQGPNWVLIKFTVRAYFNPWPKTQDDRISLFELPANARKFDKKLSLPIATRTLITKNHYSTWWGATAPIYAKAWVGSAVDGGEHDIWECYPISIVNGKPMRVPGITQPTSNCITDPSRYIPRDKFLQDSNEIVADGEIKKVRENVTERVQKILASVIINRSDIWDPRGLRTATTANDDNKYLSNRSIVTTARLADALREYSRKFLLVKNWMLINFYHGNPTSLCLSAIDAYSPQRVTKMVSDNILRDDQQSLGQIVTAAMVSAIKECSKHELDPTLRKLRDDLTKLRALQAAKMQAAN